MKGKSENKTSANNTIAQDKNSTRTEKDITAESSTANQANKVTDSQISGQSSSRNSIGNRNSR